MQSIVRSQGFTGGRSAGAVGPLVFGALILLSGCGGGSTNGGPTERRVSPLATGFDPAQRLENAASVHITPAGVELVQEQIGALLANAGGRLGLSTSFQIQEMRGTIPMPWFLPNISYAVCPGGANPHATPPTCVADVAIAEAHLTIAPTPPSEVVITGTVPVRLLSLPFHALGDMTIALDGDGSCPGNLRASFALMPVRIDVAVQADRTEAHGAAYGMSSVRIRQVVDSSELKTALTEHLHLCGSGLGGVEATILNLIKSTVAGAMVPPLEATLQTAVENAVCQRVNPAATPSCPAPSAPDSNGICRYADRQCASRLFGTDGHLDLSSALASFSPQMPGGLDFLLAAGGGDPNTGGHVPPSSRLAWGDLDPVGGGITLGLVGGAQADVVSTCVSQKPLPRPTGIPIPSELFLNDVPSWPAGTAGPHVGIAVPERVLNYVLGTVYNSGALCVRIGADSIPLLSTGTLGLLLPGLQELGLQQEPQQVAIVVRPGSPPRVTLGGGTDLGRDPLFRAAIDGISMDFYVFSLDRFLRFMTATFDVDLPVNLRTGGEGITPALGVVGLRNGRVTHSELLDQPPGEVADTLAAFLTGALGQATAKGVKPIGVTHLLSAAGMGIVLPESAEGGSPALRTITQDGERFLVLYAGIEVKPPAPSSGSGDTPAGCSMASGSGSRGGKHGGAGQLLLLVLGVWRLSRRRAWRVASASMFAALICACGSTPRPPSSDAGVGASAPDPGPTECGKGCVSLEPGLVGAYTSVAVSGRDLWVAGYSEGDPSSALSYGDLVVGTWNGRSVGWAQVDGVPRQPAVDAAHYDVRGFRGGQTAPGDDVGLWTSVAVGGDGYPAVSYYDRTHRALKFARAEGTRWISSVVDSRPNATVGLYSKLLHLGSEFVVTYEVVEPGVQPDTLVSSLRVARTAEAATEPKSWAFEEVASAGPSPSRPDPIATYPNGAFNDLSVSEGPEGKVGIAFYDRTHGRLMMASNAGGSWRTAVIDGKDPGAVGAAGVGASASLAIDAGGDWHIAYINLSLSRLQYVKVAGGTVPGPPEVVDDGMGLEGETFSDGRHYVGYDAQVLAREGIVHVSYQDATAGTLRYAVGTPTGGGHSWKVRAIPQAGFAGAFSHIVVREGRIEVVNWWRVGGKNKRGDVRVLAP